MQTIKAFKVTGPATCGRVGRTDYGGQEVTKDISVLYHYVPSSLVYQINSKILIMKLGFQIPCSFLVTVWLLVDFYSPRGVDHFELPGPKFYG